MSTRNPTKPRRKESASGGNEDPPRSDFTPGSPRKRGTALLLATAIIASIFATRLVDLQAVRGEALADAALTQRLRTMEIPAYRGSILDRSGQALAVTVEARDITADQTLIEDPAAVSVELAPILEVPQDVLADRLTGEKRFMYVAKGVTPQTWDEISALRLPGIFSQETSRRIYPAGDLASHIVGFVGADGAGGAGIESSYNELLTGTPGEQTYERGPGGRVIPTQNRSSVAAVPGSDVQLTIDRDIQFVAQGAIDGVVRRSGASSATAVVMDVQAGEILAMATGPDFDPNRLTQSLPEERRNRAITDIFEPGSTVKAFTVTAALESGLYTPDTIVEAGPGWMMVGPYEIRDIANYGTLTLEKVITKSSNIGTSKIAFEIGPEPIRDVLQRVGFGEVTGTGFPGERGGVLPNPRRWSRIETATLSYGYGLSASALQLARAYSVIADDGVRKPVSLLKLSESELAKLPREQVIEAATARRVREMLETVVDRSRGGSAVDANIPFYKVAGKTGTAHVVGEMGYEENLHNSLFVGMVPASDPKIVVVIVINEPKGEEHYGGQVAAPVFAEIAAGAMRVLNVTPDKIPEPDLALNGAN